MAEFDIRSADILEEQLCLLNVARFILAEAKMYNNSSIHEFIKMKKWQELFLDECNLIEIKKYWENNLFSMSAQNNESRTLAVAMRMICICEALRCQLYNPEQWEMLLNNSCQTDRDIDKCLGDMLTAMWTRSTLENLEKTLKRLIDFLVVFGSLQVLPDGVFTAGFKCYRCRQKCVLADLNEVNRSRNTNTQFGCSNHILSRLMNNDETKNETHTSEMKADQIEENGNPLGKASNIEQLSIGKRIARNRKELKMREIKSLLKQLDEKFNETHKEYCHLIEPKFISPNLYETIARYVLFLKQREKCWHAFALRNDTLINQSMKEKFIESLKLVQMEKMDGKLAQEEFFRLFLDPLTGCERTNKLMRSSVLAKNFLLTFGMTAEDIALMTNKISKISIGYLLSNLGDEKCNTDDRFQMAVFILYCYNKWLHLQDIDKSFYLASFRGDVKDVNVTGSYFLYDKEHIGLLINEQKFLFNYREIVDLCFTHLSLFIAQFIPIDKIL